MCDPSRKDVWGEIGLSLAIRGIWAGFFVACGTAIHNIYKNPIALAALIGCTIALLALAVAFEYRRAVNRLRYAHRIGRETHEHLRGNSSQQPV